MKKYFPLIAFAGFLFTSCTKNSDINLPTGDSIPNTTAKLVKYIVSHSVGRPYHDSLTFTYDSLRRMTSLKSSWNDTTRAGGYGSETYSFSYTGINVKPDSYIYFYQNYNDYTNSRVHLLDYKIPNYIFDSSITPYNYNNSQIQVTDNLVTYTYPNYSLLDSVCFDENKNAIQYIYYDHGRFLQKFTYSNSSYPNPIYNPYIGNILTQYLIGFGLMSKKLPDTQFIDDYDGIRTYTIEYALNNWGSVQKSITKEGNTVVNVTTYEYY
ncbi:hypothetical protein ACI6Q2_22325 [Chitinophagaceae bacterium LWZ2-11]